MTHFTGARCVNFYWRPMGGLPFLVGTASLTNGQGWRFIPNVAGRSPSRRFHPTVERCVPRWVGYPDRCESRVVERPVVAQMERDLGALLS